ncbi:Crp/Fnr family transcriptional regulator [Chryseobacterium sp. CP-77]|uniref:Crp/Fnr family transcriptional regulator n=1 Tax=Chryseobacterium sp. CP-77 TaxID=3116594 RepID=UPI002ED0A9E8
MIEEAILQTAGAYIQNYKIGDYIFAEGAIPESYFQIIEGKVKLNSLENTNKEMLHNLLGAGEDIIGFSIFSGKDYPVNAVALTDCKILIISKVDFQIMLEKSLVLAINIIYNLSEQMQRKYILSRILFSQSPIMKLTTFFNLLKVNQTDKTQFSYRVTLKRQQVANLTGLRVETVIRSVKQMEKNGNLRVVDGIIYF